MQRYRRIDVTYEAVINAFNYLEQIYKRFQAQFGLKWSWFQGKLFIFTANCYFQGKFFPPPQ